MKNSLLLLPLLAAFSSAAHADLSYTQTTSSPFGAMMGGSSGGMVTKTYAKGDASRTEAQMFGRKMITISRGAKSVMQIDPATKTYTVSNGGSAAIAKNMMPGGRGKMPSMDMTVSTQKLGVENVRGTQASHYRVNMDMKMGAAGGGRSMKMGMEIWSSNVPYPASAKTRSDAIQSMPDNLKAMFGGGAHVKGDVKAMGAAFKTVPLRMKILMNGQPISTTETSAISTKPLPASLFSAPAGYRAVSNAQFSQMQQAAIQKSMSGMMKGMPGMPPR